jgi:hypothetical protein
MLGSINDLPGTDLTTGAIMLTVFMAGVALAMIAVFGVVAFRRAGESGPASKMWRAGLVLVGVALAWAVLDRSSIRDQIAERQALEARAGELTLRAIAPGSALACLDAVAGPAVEAACEKSLFATPEAVAAAVAYVDARVSLLSASVGIAERDLSFRPAFERLRRGVEADRFGLVSHVLMTRGCGDTDCPDLKLVRDKARIMSNMRLRTFDGHVSLHSLAWNPGAVAVSASSSGSPALAGAQPSLAPQPNPPVSQTPGVAGFGPATMGAASNAHPLSDPTLSSGVITPGVSPNNAPGRPKIDFPSSASIPAVSIMTPEPGAPPAGEAKPAPRRPAQAQPPRNQAPREASPRPTAAPPQTAPQQAPPQQTPPPAQPPQTSGTR